MRSLIAGLVLALLVVVPVAGADPSLELATAGPYHHGQLVSVIVHGDVPGHPREPRPKAHIRLLCYQSGEVVHAEFVYSPASETSYALHLSYGPSGAGISLWDTNGGGAADCTLSLYSVRYPGGGWYVEDTIYTSIDFHVEA